MPTIEERVAYIEGQMSEQSHALLELRDAIRHLDQKMDARFDLVDRRFASIDQRFETFDRRFEAIDRRFAPRPRPWTDASSPSMTRCRASSCGWSARS